MCSANVVRMVNILTTYLDQVYDKYKLPIWLTEVGLFNQAGSLPQSVLIDFMTRLVEALVARPYVHRWAWYKVMDHWDPPRESTLVSYPSGNITALGETYRSLAIKYENLV